MARKPRTCVVCRKPVLTKLRLRLWITINGLDFHPQCLRTVRKDEKRRQALISARSREQTGR
jgi:hypothetical protein